MKSFKFLSNKENDNLIFIPIPDDILCILMKEVYRDGYLAAMVGNEISTNRYLHTPYAYMWNRGWLDYSIRPIL